MSRRERGVVDVCGVLGACVAMVAMVVAGVAEGAPCGAPYVESSTVTWKGYECYVFRSDQVCVDVDDMLHLNYFDAQGVARGFNIALRQKVHHGWFNLTLQTDWSVDENVNPYASTGPYLYDGTMNGSAADLKGHGETDIEACNWGNKNKVSEVDFTTYAVGSGNLVQQTVYVNGTGNTWALLWDPEKFVFHVRGEQAWQGTHSWGLNGATISNPLTVTRAKLQGLGGDIPRDTGNMEYFIYLGIPSYYRQYGIPAGFKGEVVLKDFKMGPEPTCTCSSGACCDGCNYKSSGTSCRPSSASCDPEEKCSGSSADCPADATNCSGPTEGLVALWHLDEGTGTRSVDSAGHGLTASLVNMTSTQWVAGVSGNATEFLKNSGVLRVADTGRVLALTGDSSWSLWLKFSSMGFDEPIYKNGVFQLYHLGDVATGAALYWTVGITNSSIAAGDSQWKGQAAILTNTTFAVSRWYHVVGVRVGNELRVYVDGKLDKSLTCMSGHSVNPAAATELTVGMFTGTVDEMSVHSYALTASEVQAAFDKYHRSRTEKDKVDASGTLLLSGTATLLVSVLVSWF